MLAEHDVVADNDMDSVAIMKDTKSTTVGLCGYGQ